MKTDKKFRLFKESDQPGAPYYFKFEFRKKDYKRCLETNDAAQAQKYAWAKYREITAALVSEDHARLAGTSLRSAPTGTVRQILDAYKTCAVDAEAPARRQNGLALRQLLRTAAGEVRAEGSAPMPVDPNGPELDASITAINGALARSWFQQASARTLAAKTDQDKATIKRTANSRYVQARSVFAPKALATYKDLGLDHPGFEEFLEAGKVHRFGKVPLTSFNPPAEAVIQKTLATWQALEDRNLFLAIGHELAFGLRAAEWGFARWSWWTAREGYPVIDGEVQEGERVKNGSGLVQVRALDPWFSIMRARVQSKGWKGGPGDYIISGTPTMRTDATPRAVSAWMRALGWKTKKTNHEIRKYVGSQIAMRYGMYEASHWLRHSSVTVTEGHYAGYVRKFKPADPETLPARWAAIGKPELHIVAAGAP